MPKYYVQSGDFKVVIEGINSFDGAVEAFFQHFDCKNRIGKRVYVSETGFDGFDTYVYFPKDLVLECAFPL